MTGTVNTRARGVTLVLKVRVMRAVRLTLDVLIERAVRVLLI